MPELTKASQHLLKALCKEYRHRKKLLSDDFDCRIFCSPQQICDSLLNEIALSDIEAACFELKREGYISALETEGSLSEIILSDAAIHYGETAFSRACQRVLQTMAGLRSLLP